MPAPIIPIVLGLGLLVLASKPKTARAGAVTSTQPPGKVPPPVTPSGFSCPPAGTPDGEIASLPPQVAGPINLALTLATDPATLDTLATQLEICGLNKAAASVRRRASEIRVAAGGGVVPIPVPGVKELPDTPSGGSGKFASLPATQWQKTVQKAGETPIGYTTSIFGPDGEEARNPATGQRRWVEFVLYNKPAFSTVGDPNDPYGTMTGSVPFNFASYKVGDVFLVPKTWNAWIADDGTKRGALDPWPAPTGGVSI